MAARGGAAGAGAGEPAGGAGARAGGAGARGAGGAGGAGGPERALWALVLRRLRGVGGRAGGEEARGRTPVRERLCERLFGDVAGLLDANARAETGAPAGARFYGVLACWLEGRPEEAWETLEVCRAQWQQPYISLTMAALLHRWLFSTLAACAGAAPRGDPAGAGDDFLRVCAVCLQGAENLFWTDFKSAGRRFAEVFDFLADGVLLSPGYPLDQALEAEGRQRIRRLVVRFLPYYRSDEALACALDAVPLEPVPPPPGRGGVGGAGAGAGAGAEPDALEERGGFLLRELTAMLGSAKAEEGLVRYLGRLQMLDSAAWLPAAAMVPTLRFQMRLHELSRSGGPLYPPRRVRHAALGAYARLYPTGRHFRRMLKFSANIFHPADLPGHVVHSLRGGSAGLRRGAAGSWRGLLWAGGALLGAAAAVAGATWGRLSDFLLLLWLLLWQMPRIRLTHWAWEAGSGAHDLLGALVALRRRGAPAV